MPSKRPPDQPGYSPLLWVDTSTGRFNGSETVLVPSPLAAKLNAARIVLHDRRKLTEAWALAGVRPENPVPDDDVAELTPQEGAAKLQAVRGTRPVAARATQAPRKPRIASGRPVGVISAAVIAQRLDDVQRLTKFSSEEKKTELKILDGLLARGATRLVGLKADWRPRIARMRADMPHLSKVIDRIEACCALSVFTRQPLRIPPLLLVGPPGVGKTHFARCVADLLGVPSFLYALESAETVAVLTGSEKYWGNSEPGLLYRLIVQGEFANPLVILDELDKVSAGNHYRPANALHAVLEPSTAGQLRDKCIDMVFDASHVVYIATANRLSPIDASLLSRFELFLVEEPGARAAVAIARAIGLQVLREMKLTRRFGAPTGEVVQQLAMLGSPRRMHKVLTAAVGRAVVGGRSHVRVADLMDEPLKDSPVSSPAGGSDELLH